MEKTSWRTPVLFLPCSPSLPASHQVPGCARTPRCGTDPQALWEAVSLGLRTGHPGQVVSLVIQHSSPLCCQLLCPLLQISMSPSPAPHCPHGKHSFLKEYFSLSSSLTGPMQIFHFLSCDSSCQWCLCLPYKQEP